MRRSLDPLRETRKRLELPDTARSIVDVMRSDPVRQALAARDAALAPSAAVTLARVRAAGGILDQFRAGLASNLGAIEAARYMATLTSGADLGLNGIFQTEAARRATTLASLQTGGGVAEAVRALQDTVLGNGVLASLMRQRDADALTASRRLQEVLGATSFRHLVEAGASTSGLVARASKWSAERRATAASLAGISGAAAFSTVAAAALFGAIGARPTDDWRTILDGTVGPSLAASRPVSIAAFADIQRRAAPLAALGRGGTGSFADPAMSAHFADQLARMRSTLDALVEPLNAALARSRVGGEVVSSAAVQALVDQAADVGAGLDEVGRAGTMDALLRFLDDLLARFADNTRREMSEAGAITLLIAIIALFQATIWIHPNLTPQPDSAPPPGIERVVHEQRAMSDKLDDIAAVLAHHEEDNLASIDRAQVKRPSIVRAGPGTRFAQVRRLGVGEIVGARDREDGWTLVFYRDQLSGTVGSGWVSSRLLADPQDR